MGEWEQGRCCCCFSVKAGTILLGVISTLAILDELNEFHPLRLAANGVAAISFLLMLCDDSDFKRKLFYYSYSASQVLIYVYAIFRSQGSLEKSKPWDEVCKSLQQ